MINEIGRIISLIDSKKHIILSKDEIWDVVESIKIRVHALETVEKFNHGYPFMHMDDTSPRLCKRCANWILCYCMYLSNECSFSLKPYNNGLCINEMYVGDTSSVRAATGAYTGHTHPFHALCEKSNGALCRNGAPSGPDICMIQRDISQTSGG